jgi:hypothetical protein
MQMPIEFGAEIVYTHWAKRDLTKHNDTPLYYLERKGLVQIITGRLTSVFNWNGNMSWETNHGISNTRIYYTHLPNSEVLNTKVAQSVSCPRFEQKLERYLNFWIPCGLHLQIFLNFSYLWTSATTHLYILKCLSLAEAGVK